MIRHRLGSGLGDRAVESPIPLARASRLFDSRPSVATLWRWMQLGIIGRNGDRVRLRFLMIGKRRYIEPSAVREFVAACNASQHGAVGESPSGASEALEALGC